MKEKTIYKKLISLIIAGIIIISGAFFASCKNDDPPGNNSNPPETVSEEEKAFLSLTSRINVLENVSFSFNQTGYENRVFIYIRNKTYNDSQWNFIGGTMDSGFEDYVEENQGSYNLKGLQTLNSFVIPKTNESVDFVHMFATMNAINNNINNTQTADLAGWGGDLCQLVAELKDTDFLGTDLDNLVNQKFNKQDSSFNDLDVCADLDAVNIMSIYNSSSNKSISKHMKDYYNSLTKSSRKTQFKNNIFSQTLSQQEAIEYLFTRIKDNLFLNFWCSQNNVSFETHSHIFNACINAFVSFLNS